MIWGKKNRSPITIEDEEFVKESFDWVINTFGHQILRHDILSPDDFNLSFSEKDLEPVFTILCDRMDVNPKKIKLFTYKERRQMELDDSLITQYSEETTLTSGKYKQYSDGDVEIWVEEGLFQKISITHSYTCS